MSTGIHAMQTASISSVQLTIDDVLALGFEPDYILVKKIESPDDLINALNATQHRSDIGIVYLHDVKKPSGEALSEWLTLGVDIWFNDCDAEVKHLEVAEV